MRAWIGILVALASLAIGINGYGCEYGYGIGYIGTQAEAKYEGGYQEATVSQNSPTSQIVLINPTFKEVRDFIIKDPSSTSEFILNQYECRHFATEVCNSAEAEGIRCSFVLLCYERGQHAVVAFDTTDRGLVYIEPQTDAAIHPEVGGKYQEQEIKEILVAW